MHPRPLPLSPLRSVLYALIGLIMLTPALAIELNFFDQGALRYMTDADLAKMSAGVDQVLASAEPAARIEWSNAESGNSGTIAAIKRFEEQGMQCRRLRIENYTKETRATATPKVVDMCQVDGQWKLLGLPENP